MGCHKGLWSRDPFRLHVTKEHYCPFLLVIVVCLTLQRSSLLSFGEESL